MRTVRVLTKVSNWDWYRNTPGGTIADIGDILFVHNEYENGDIAVHSSSLLEDPINDTFILFPEEFEYVS